jgi:single-stranded-DNA-specific exonuclease
VDSAGARAWRLRATDDRAIALLSRELKILPATARVLSARGIQAGDAAQAYLFPRLAQLRPPSNMAGFARAVDRLCDALAAGQIVGVFGDYDVDGVTSAAILTTFLRSVGAAVVTRVAERDAGYGFGEAAALWFADQRARVVVTVDCGTSDLPAIAAARARGVDVIVLDHHQVPERSEHPALALVNPHRADSAYPYRGLASAGLSFFLAAALRTALRERGFFGARPIPDVRELLDLVAVGTLADLAPLTLENRILVTAGLRELNARRRPGVLALCELAGLAPDKTLDEIDVGWKLAPRLNAPGRMGDAAPALDLLLAADARQAQVAAAACETANLRRRELQDRMVAEALEDAADLSADAALVVARAGWHPGVAGIVAAKLVDRFGKPSAVIALDEARGQGRGSLRTTGGFNLYQALEACREHLLRFGGHAQAAGVTVAAGEIQALRRAFAEQAARARPALPDVAVDAVVPLGEVSEQLAAELAALSPFGVGNEAPVIAAAGARVRASRRVGDDGAHLKLTLECERHATAHQAIAFRMGPLDPGVGATIDVAYRPEISEWRGERRLELTVCALRPGGGLHGIL